MGVRTAGAQAQPWERAGVSDGEHGGQSGWRRLLGGDGVQSDGEQPGQGLWKVLGWL